MSEEITTLLDPPDELANLTTLGAQIITVSDPLRVISKLAGGEQRL